jgi:hypothetical protein
MPYAGFQAAEQGLWSLSCEEPALALMRRCLCCSCVTNTVITGSPGCAQHELLLELHECCLVMLTDSDISIWALQHLIHALGPQGRPEGPGYCLCC